jgi:serine/threonine protein kinase
VLRSTGGRIEIGRATALFDQVLDALGHAHAQGIVHRDMKPHNVLLTTDGAGREIAKVTDFGLARHFESTGCSGLTRTGNRRGTLAYMAPEQLLDARRADPRSDLYGTAAALYRLLTGCGLWNEKPNGDDPLLLVLNQPPVPIQQRRGDVPAPLAAVIHKALARDPRDRFANAAEMRAALRACM